MSARSVLEEALRKAARSVSVVSMRSRAHGYRRMWKVQVVFVDGVSRTYWADDDDISLARQLSAALAEATRPSRRPEVRA